ncbi:unnamed protein product, partial [Ilex paraguariensis]
ATLHRSTGHVANQGAGLGAEQEINRSGDVFGDDEIRQAENDAQDQVNQNKEKVAFQQQSAR